MDSMKVLICMIALIAVAVPVGAITQELGNGGVGNTVWYGYDDVNLISGGCAGTDYMVIDSILYNTNLKHVGWFTFKGNIGSGRGTYGTYCGPSDSDFRNMSSTTPYSEADSRAVELYIGSDRIGSGRIAYNTYVTGGSIYLAMSFFPDSVDWDLSDYSGTQMLNITYEDSEEFDVGMGTLNSGSAASTYMTNSTNPKIGLFGNRSYNAWMNGRCHAAPGACGLTSGVTDYGFAGFYRYSFYSLYSLVRDATSGLTSLTFYKQMEDTNESWASMVYLTNGNHYVYWNESTVNNVDIISEEFPNQPPLQVCAKDYTGTWWNGTILYTTADLNTYQLILDNESVNTGAEFHPRIYSVTDLDLSDLIRIKYYAEGIEGNAWLDNLYVGGNKSRPYDMQLSGGTWYGWDETTTSYSVDMGATAPNPVTGTLENAGEYTIHADVQTSGGSWQLLEANLTVGGSSACFQVIQIENLQGNLIAGSTIAVYNQNTGAWTNTTSTSGKSTITLSGYSRYKIYGVASGYTTDSFDLETGYIGSAGETCFAPIVLTLISTAEAGGGNILLGFMTQEDESLAPISGATVKIEYTDPSNSTLMRRSLTTGKYGTGSFNLVPNTTEVSYSVTHPNYKGTSGTYTTTTENHVIFVDMIPITAITTRTTAATPTPTVVPHETSHRTGFWKPVMDGFVQMGASNAELDILMAALIVCLGCLIGGLGPGMMHPGAGFVSGIGANAGGIFAIILACAFNFISIVWIIAAFMWIVFAYIFFK